MHAELARYRFIAGLDDAIRLLTDPEQIAHTAARLLGEFLGAERCAYAYVSEDQGSFTLTGNYTNGLPSIVGRYELAAFGAEFTRLNRRGQPYVVMDTETDERVRDVLQAYRGTGIRAVISVPVIKGDRWVAGMALHQSTPRHWQEHEVRLLEAVANRSWESIERGRMAIELRKSEAHLQSVFEQTAAGICEVDLEGRILQVNDRYGEILGRSREELLSMRMQDLTHPEDVVRNVPLFKRAIATGEPFEIEKRYLRPDGSIVWVNNMVSLIRVPGEQASDSILAVCIDITKRKRVEEALREADRRKDEFLAMLAHELRNPMAPIRAAADLLETVELDPEQRRRTSQIISRQVRHMTGLVDDLLDVSRVTRGLVEMQKTRLDVKQVIADAIEQARPLMEAKRHRLVVELAFDATQVLGDHKRLVQVLSNLLNNAAKYTPAEGRIAVTMAATEAQVVLEVADNGIGIALALQERVFDLFTQADRSSDRSQGGLGIGLALVRSLVELHDGSVACRSAGVDKGSRFIVTLPRAADQDAPAPAQGEAPAAPSPTRRVLVVDDNVDAAQMLGMCLEVAGHEVMLEYGPLQALERVRTARPEVCILDIGLPGMDGNELARRLRSQPETAGATLIALTGYGQEHDRKNAIAAGFDYHLVKPVAAPELLALMAEARRLA